MKKGQEASLKLAEKMKIKLSAEDKNLQEKPLLKVLLNSLAKQDIYFSTKLLTESIIYESIS